MRFAIRATLGFTVLASLSSQRAAAQTAGVTYTFRTVTTSSSTPVSTLGPLSSEGRIQVAGGRMRMEFTDSQPHPPAGVGAVMLRLEDEQLLYLDPAKHVYFPFDQARSMEQMKARGVSLRITDPTITVERLGPGEPLLAEATEVWRMTQRYTIATTAMGQEITMAAESITDVTYGATPVARPDVATPGAAAPSTILSPEFTARIRAAWRQMPARVPLRTIMTTVTRRDGQEVSRLSVTTDVRDVARGLIPDSVFVVPAGYQKISMPNELPR